MCQKTRNGPKQSRASMCVGTLRSSFGQACAAVYLTVCASTSFTMACNLFFCRPWLLEVNLQVGMGLRFTSKNCNSYDMQLKPTKLRVAANLVIPA